jgi:hypothetical protein
MCLCLGNSGSLPVTASERDARQATAPGAMVEEKLVNRVTLKQLQSFSRHVDDVKQKMAVCGAVLPSSDFRRAELTAQSSFEDVIFFQRGDVDAGNEPVLPNSSHVRL